MENGVFGFILGLFAGCLVMGVVSWPRYRQKAIDAGVARWICDEATGKRTFVYKCGCEKCCK
jgi:uncharacterized protein YbcV (DUF1398 family)